MSQAVLFKQEGQHIYDYTNVYDPDIDGADPSASGKIIPAVRSIVIDNRSSDWKIYLVKSVDSRTFKCTYMDFPYKTIDRRSMILNYGNDMFMLYYDNRTTPTRLTVDAKMILFGSNIASYRLLKGSDVISYTLEQGATAQYVPSTVPVIEVTDKYVDGIRRCNTCYTTSVLTDGDIVTLELYDSTGVMIAEVELIARKSTILNSLTAAFNPIIGFTAVANQMVGEEWYLYKGQPKDNLSIYPEIRFADGSTYVVPVDNNACYMYGFDDIDTLTAKPGEKYPILIKYYINSRYQVDPSLNVVAGTKRVLSSSHTLVILERMAGSISKISVIPVWNAPTNSYSLKMLAYNGARDGVSDLTAKVFNDSSGTGGFKENVCIAGGFNPTRFGVKQDFTIKIGILTENGFSADYEQSFSIILKSPSSLPGIDTGRDRWQIINPSNPDIVYGVDNAAYNRPVVYWDAEASDGGRHYISTSEFSTVDKFIEVFYRLSAPPIDVESGESEAPRPTHFRFRDVSGNLLTDSIAVEDYNRGIVIRSLAGVPITGGTVVMEFLYNHNDSAVGAIVYGVPVLVEQNNGSYVNDAND